MDVKRTSNELMHSYMSYVGNNHELAQALNLKYADAVQIKKANWLIIKLNHLRILKMAHLKVTFRELNTNPSDFKGDMRMAFKPPFEPDSFGLYAYALLFLSFIFMS